MHRVRVMVRVKVVCFLLQKGSCVVVVMSTSRKRICSNDDEGENVREEMWYAKMKVKMKKYEFELEQLRMELLETKHI